MKKIPTLKGITGWQLMNASQKAIGAVISKEYGSNAIPDQDGIRDLLAGKVAYAVRPSRLFPNRVVVTPIESVGLDDEGNIVFTTRARGIRGGKFEVTQ